MIETVYVHMWFVCVEWQGDSCHYNVGLLPHSSLYVFRHHIANYKCCMELYNKTPTLPINLIAEDADKPQEMETGRQTDSQSSKQLRLWLVWPAVYWVLLLCCK